MLNNLIEDIFQYLHTSVYILVHILHCVGTLLLLLLLLFQNI